MNAEKLDTSIREYYATQQLPAEALERIRERARQVRPPRFRGWSIAAAAVILIVASLLFIQAVPDPAEAPAAVRIARQAATAHHQRLAPEVREADYVSLRARMEKLDFSPLEPDSLRNTGMQLLGARYSNLDGKIAVQLSLIDKNGELCTLFQFRDGEGLDVMRKESVELDGIVVDVWKEKGLVMALARPPA